MAKQLSILYVSSEVYPFVKVTGLADVSYSLPLAMRDLGHDMRVMLPKYGAVSERKNRIHEINRLRDMPIPIGSTQEPVTIKSSSINNPRVKVQAYITTNHKYFDSKKGVYHDPLTWKEYPDNAERFIFFNRSVIETCLLLGWFPDIIHCNNWQAALIPAYINTLFPAKFKKTKTIFTIHNFAYQGAFPLSEFEKTGMPKSVLSKFTHNGMMNFVKGGIEYANYMTTVSPTYANDILKDNEYGNGLNNFLKHNSGKFSGILNGIDIWSWNPKSDSFIDTHYSYDYYDYKYNNKVSLLNKFNLEFHPKAPVIGMISRIDKEKGINLFIDAAKEIFSHDVRVVFLGEGDSNLKKKLLKIVEKYPDKFSVKFDIDDPLAHLIEAGSDMFLIPSEHEPCSLNLMYSLIYGAVPILHFTGGMKDVAIDYDADSKKGNSFTYEENSAKALAAAVRRALKLFENKEEWESLAKNGMEGDYSWAESAKKYDEIYRNLMKD